MKTLTVNAYEFSELSPKAKEKAREWYRRANDGDNSWSDSTIEEAVREGELLGIDFKTRDVKLHGGGTRQDPCIWWSGFWSQGDGACFEGTWRARDVKADKVADGWGDAPATTEIKRIAAEFGRIAKAYPGASFTVKHSGHYNHEHCTEFDFSVADDDLLVNDGEVEKVEADLTEAAKDFMRWIYKQLEAEYEYQNSDEQIDETITANEYLFSEAGKREVVL